MTPPPSTPQRFHGHGEQVFIHFSYALPVLTFLQIRGGRRKAKREWGGRGGEGEGAIPRLFDAHSSSGRLECAQIPGINYGVELRNCWFVVGGRNADEWT